MTRTLQMTKTQAEYYQKNKVRLRKAKSLWIINYRLKAVAFLGGKCVECNTTEKLQLHHKYYARDSVRPTQHEFGNVTIKRSREALAHPGRFSLLCLSCHNSKQPRRKPTVSLAGMFDGLSEVKEK